MVNDQFLAKFKKKIWLINTSRGQVVNTRDLVQHLKTGKVLGAALDVLEFEDSSFEMLGDRLPAGQAGMPEEFKYLCTAGNVVMTPHIGGWTVESRYKLAQVLVDKIKDLMLNDDSKMK